MRHGFRARRILFALYCMACSIGSAHAATAAPIVVAAPEGGEIFFAGQTQTVRLDPKTRAKSVLIELTRDDGATFIPIGSIDNTVKDKTKRNVLTFIVAARA